MEHFKLQQIFIEAANYENHIRDLCNSSEL